MYPNGPALGSELVAHGAEVDERERAVRPPDHVSRLQVAMDDRRRATVEVPEHVVRVAKQAHDVLFTQHTAPLAKRSEALAFDLLHHEVERALLLEVVDVRRQLRMGQRTQHLGFALRELDVLPRLRPAHVEALDGDGLSLALVDSVVRPPLRALTKRLQHDEPAVAQVTH
jgi:hypothetical protein